MPDTIPNALQYIKSVTPYNYWLREIKSLCLLYRSEAVVETG